MVGKVNDETPDYFNIPIEYGTIVDDDIVSMDYIDI